MMTTRKKIAAILAMPAAFVAAFVLAFLVAGVADAFAQPGETPTPTETDKGERPAFGHAPPSDDMTNDDVDKDALKDAASKDGPGTSPTQDAHGGDAHGGHHGGDRTEHWNWFGIHYGKDLAGGKYGDGKNFDPKTGKAFAGAEEPMSAPFVMMALNFVILMFLLVRLGRPAAKKLAADRHDQIKSALDEAAKLRKQAQDKLTEYETKLKDADSEIKKMVEGMRADAEADKLRILANAAAQSAQMQKDADQRIAAEIEYARATLTREVTAAAATATEKLLREKMLLTDQHALVGTFIHDLKVEPAAKERT